MVDFTHDCIFEALNRSMSTQNHWTNNPRRVIGNLCGLDTASGLLYAVLPSLVHGHTLIHGLRRLSSLRCQTLIAPVQRATELTRDAAAKTPDRPLGPQKTITLEELILFGTTTPALTAKVATAFLRAFPQLDIRRGTTQAALGGIVTFSELRGKQELRSVGVPVHPFTATIEKHEIWWDSSKSAKQIPQVVGELVLHHDELKFATGEVGYIDQNDHCIHVVGKMSELIHLPSPPSFSSKNDSSCCPRYFVPLKFEEIVLSYPLVEDCCILQNPVDRNRIVLYVALASSKMVDHKYVPYTLKSLSKFVHKHWQAEVVPPDTRMPEIWIMPSIPRQADGVCLQQELRNMIPIITNTSATSCHSLVH